MIIGIFAEGQVIAPASDEALELFSKGSYGSHRQRKLFLSLYEALYLQEKGKLAVEDRRGREIGHEDLLKKALRYDKDLVTKYAVYADMRDRGYVVKTALKYGAEFRVYDRGVRPGEDHAKWVLYPVPEKKGFSWYEFSAKNRVAHSTRKRLLIGIVDEEGEPTYYEVRWMRP